MNDSRQIPLLPPSIDAAALVPTINDRLRKIQLMMATQSGASAVLFGTHARRLLQLKASDHSGSAYFESDRDYVVYLSDGKQWHFAGGIMYGPLANRPGGLSNADEGFYYLTSDQPQALYRWTRGAWATALGSLPWAFQGSYSSLTSYSPGDVVSFAGTLWISTISNNLNVNPLSPPSDPPAWVMANWLRLAGVASFQRQEWDSTTRYKPNDVASYLGELWVAQTGNTNTPPTLYYQGDAAPVWAPLDANNIVVTDQYVGYGLNLRWGGNSWVSGISPDNGGGAVLVDATTGIVSFFAVPELPNAAAPYNPQAQLVFPGSMETPFLSADPRLNRTSYRSLPFITNFWPFNAEAWLLVENADALTATVRVRFDLTGLTPAVDRIFKLQDNLDPAGNNVTLAGLDPCHGGTGMHNVPGDGLGWQVGAVLVGAGPDSTVLLFPPAFPAPKAYLRYNTATLVAEYATVGDAAAGTYGDATHVAQVTIDADGRVSNITSVAIGTSGYNGTVPLAKLTGGGANGSLTVVNGVITGVLPPT